MIDSNGSRCPLVRSAGLAVVTLLAAVIPSLGQEATPSTFWETTSVTLIEIPVVVLQDGVPVRDLTAVDFVLTEDGVEQTIVGFEQVDLTVGRLEPAALEERPVSLAGRRYFLLAFDLSHTDPANARRAVEAAKQLVDGGLHPTDLVGVSIYSAVAGARLLHPFTSDKSQLESALLAVEAVTSRDPKVVEQARVTLAATEGGSAENLLRFLEEIRGFATQQGLGLESAVGPAGQWLAGSDTSGPGAMMVETLADMEAFHQENTLYITRDRSLDLLETLSDLASALEEVRGQKHFVLFSEGIELSLFGEYSYIQGMKRFSNTHGTNSLGEVLKSFRQSGWVVQAVNVTQGPMNTRRGMFFLAEETGGREYRNFGRLDQAMSEMLEQTSVSYVLSFQPEDLVPDGSYHEIEVRMRKADGRKVRHRAGYLAPGNPNVAREEDYLVAVPDRIASEDEGGPFVVNILAAPFKHSEASAEVRTVVEIDGQSLLQNLSGELLPIEIETYLLDEDAGAILLSTKKLTLDVDGQGELVRTGGVKVLDEHLLGPGTHRLRVAVIDRAGNRQSVATSRVQVPDFAAAGTLWLEPFFPELSPSWLVVRETATGESADSGSPFQFGGRQFVPRAAVDLEAGQKVPVVIMGMGSAEIASRLAMELVAADGQRREDGHFGAVTPPEHTEDGWIRLMVELDTTGLEPGRYEVQVGLDNGLAETGRTATRTIEIH